MGSIQYACKTIANLVSRAGISDLTGLQVNDRTRVGHPPRSLHDRARCTETLFEAGGAHERNVHRRTDAACGASHNGIGQNII